MKVLRSWSCFHEHFTSLALAGLLWLAPAGAQMASPPQDASPDGLWQILENPAFPRGFPQPEAFVALKLDEAALNGVLGSAPRETFGPVPPGTEIWLPLPGGGFGPVDVARTRFMEAELTVQFPELGSWVFQGRTITGNVVRGTRGFTAAAQTSSGIWHIEPVPSGPDRFYIAYLDDDRTDGLNEFVHDPDMDDHSSTGLAVAGTLQALAAPPIQFTNDISAGGELRIYRLLASTTGEFYQANDGGGGLADVISRLLTDIAGANAVFEPEVSVRLVLADASTEVIYDDPDTDPFDNSDSACNLRNANRDNAQAEVDDGDYDLGFLFAARPGSGANGCAWFVVCLADKARGAGLMGNNGMNSAAGLLAHEVGHQLGAHHTFSGQDGSCTENEFTVDNSESGYEPGSGTTRMSYRGICASDDVDTSAVPAGNYFHSRSFDEIVDNVFNGAGATCGTLVQTGNQPPTVDAGPDYTIPRQTPFVLSGSGTDDEVLTFNWEQFDRALYRRPINTDPGDGPIIRSVPPGDSPQRTIPHLPDLLDGTTRKGEILPQTDRELNFRLVARDNLPGGGGVAYDSMKITVSGEPFFITSPNGGFLGAGCEVPMTWQVGGGAVAAQVEADLSEETDDGQLINSVALTGPVPNDGADSFIVPCKNGSDFRLRLQAVGNIFFDVSDSNLSIANEKPQVTASISGGEVDENCSFEVEFSATATDSCGLLKDDVEVSLSKAAENFTLGTPTVDIQQVSPTEVSVEGSVLVTDLTDSPVKLGLLVKATDGCGAFDTDSVEAEISDNIPPAIDIALGPDTLWPPNHKMKTITATVTPTDNCPGVTFALDSILSDEPENGLGDGDTAPDVMGADTDQPDLQFKLRAERSGNGDGRIYTVTYSAKDGADNVTQNSAEVIVPFSQGD